MWMRGVDVRMGIGADFGSVLGGNNYGMQLTITKRGLFRKEIVFFIVKKNKTEYEKNKDIILCFASLSTPLLRLYVGDRQ